MRGHGKPILGRFLSSLLVVGLLVAGGWVASLASARALADGGLARERATGTSIQAPLPATSSRTQPYAACPPPKRGYAACQSIVVPPGAELRALPASALPATGGVDGSGLTPAELQSAYKLPSASAGEGQTVALVDAFDDPTAESDLATYRSAYGLPPCTSESGCLRKVNQAGGTAYPPVAKAENGDWELEESLDLDMVSAICPQCHILLVEAESNTSENLDAAEAEAARLGATEISNSWGSPEYAGDSERDADFHFPGIPVTAAAGDDGYDNYEIGAETPLYPAASPNVIAVGGTVLSQAANSRGFSESVWPRSGSGCSLYEPKPSYQADGGCDHRTSNDVAAVAEDLSVYDTTHATGDGGLPKWVTVDGTSASTPIIAAVEALSEPAERALGAEAFYESPGSLFDIVSGSNGACSVLYLCEAGGGYDGPTGNGTPDGALSLSAPAPPPQLTVRGYGTGYGSVSSSPAGIECGSSCSTSFALGTKVTLTATPSAGSSFEGWQGPCTGTGACTVTLNAGAAVTATFRASGAPAGWSEATLAAPDEREPLAPETSPEDTFYNVSLSANGDVRSKTVFNPPSGFCYYATSNTGGVFLERREGSSWISEGELSAPAVGKESEARWANCDHFGEVTKLSADGSTLLVSQDADPTYAAERCAAFVYRHGPHGWTLEATLFPPGIGPSGTKTEGGCNYFGVQGAISDDGKHIAIMGNRNLYMFVREPSGWSLEQQIVLPEGANCNASVGVRTLALSGDASTALVGKPDCETDGYFGDGSVYAYTRSGASWSLSQTIEAPEPYYQDDFGNIVSVSEDGSTAVVSSNRNLAGDPPAAWVYERLEGRWRERARLTDPTTQGESGFGCSAIVAGGGRILCGAYDTVGFNGQQGSIYAFERPSGGWSPPAEPQVARLFATNGFPSDFLGRSGKSGWQGFGASADGSVVDAPISAFNIANGLYPDALIGYEFRGPPVYSKPTIAGLTPAEGAAGATVTIAGENLLDASVVSFAGTPAASYDAESPTQITATVPRGAGSGPISVTTPGGTATSAEGFTVVKPVYAPEVTSISPSEGPTSGDTTVAITGTHFLDGVSVRIGGLASEVNVRSETEITARTPAQPAGSYDVVVSDEAGSSSGTVSYTYLPPPTVSSITPQAGEASGANAVTIVGSHFLPGATVTIDGRALQDEVVSESEISAVTTETPPGSYEVIVSDRGGSSIGGPSYSYLAAPTISSITPSSGPAGGGTKLTIRGSNFVQADALVLIGSGSAVPHVLSQTKMTLAAPAQPAGSYEVRVSDAGGSTTSGPTYTYLASVSPSVSSVSPAEGTIAGGTALTIEGSGFVKGAKVTIGPKGHARAVHVVSEHEITATTRREPAGSYEVIVSDKLGSSQGGPSFTYSVQASDGVQASAAAWLAPGLSNALLAALAHG